MRCAVWLITLAALIAVTVYFAGCGRGKTLAADQQVEKQKENRDPNVKLTVVYDNNVYKEGLTTGWGFASVLTGTEKTILFDTGADGRVLLDNMDKLAIEPDSIQAVVLSHIHGDHTGGLLDFLSRNNNVTVYLPQTFGRKFKERIKQQGAKIVEVQEPVKICENVYSTGLLGTWIKEQGLLVQSDQGAILITGCSHPGIVKMVKAAGRLSNEPVLAVFGGFHLEWAGKGKIEKIISNFKQLGVKYVGPCHCTGGKARALFKQHFDHGYIEVGAGRIIETTDLK